MVTAVNEALDTCDRDTMISLAGELDTDSNVGCPLGRPEDSGCPFCSAPSQCPGTDPLEVDLGDIVTYCYNVTNTGQVALYNITLVDDMGTPGDDNDDVTVTLGKNTLKPRESTSGTLNHKVTSDDMPSRTNIANVTGTPPVGDNVTASDDCTIEAAEQQEKGSLKIVKYNDLDGSGNCTPSEPLLSGWVFNVTDPENYSWSGSTGSKGSVTISGLTPGAYNVTETLQTGWNCTDPGSGLVKEVSITSDNTTTVYFGNQQEVPTPTCAFHTIGFWKHQFAANITGKGEAQVSGEELKNYLVYIQDNYPESAGLYNTTGEKTEESEISFEEAYGALMPLISVKQDKEESMRQRAMQQYLATLLNFAANPGYLDELVDTGGDGGADTVFSAAINQIEAIFLDKDATLEKLESAKDMCESINKMHE